MEFYEESMPLQVDTLDYSLLFVSDENISQLDYATLLIKKGENYQKEFFLRKIPSLVPSPKLLTQILNQICPVIEQWNENLQIILIENIFEISNLILKKQKIDEQYKILLTSIVSQIIRLIVILEEKLSNEYIFYFDQIIKLISNKKIFIQVGSNLIEFISSLGKFGQDKRNRRLSAYLCSCVIQITKIDNKEVEVLHKRILILFSDSDRIVKLQVANELQFLLPILIGRDDYKTEVYLIIENLLRSDEEIIVRCLTVESLMNNIKYINKSIGDKIAKSLKEIFSNEMIGIDTEILNKIISTFIKVVKTLRYQEELINLDKFYQIETIQLLITNFLYVKNEENLNFEVLSKIFSIFDDVFYAIKKVTHDDSYYIRGIVERIMKLISGDEDIGYELSEDNSNKIRDMVIVNFDKFIPFLIKEDIELIFQNIIDVYCLFANGNVLNLMQALRGLPTNYIFINALFGIVLKEGIDIFIVYDTNEKNENFISALKGIKFIIPTITKKRNIKRKDEIISYIFEQIKIVLESDKIYKIKKAAVKIIPNILKYSNDNIIKEKIIIHCFNEIGNHKSFYSRRIIYSFFKEAFKTLSSNFIIERKIVQKIIELITRTKIPIELCEILQILTFQNHLLLFDNKKLENAIIDIRQKNLKDTELDKLYEKTVKLIKEKSTEGFLPNHELLTKDRNKLKEEIDLANTTTNLFLSSDSIHKNLKIKFRYDVKINPQNKLLKKKLGNSTKILPPVLSQTSQIDFLSSPIHSNCLVPTEKGEENNILLTEDNEQLHNILKVRREFKSKSYKLKKIDKTRIQLDVKQKKKLSTTPNSRPIIKKYILAKDIKDSLKCIDKINLSNKKPTPINSFRYVIK